ncbi:LysE family translocator [Aeromicrobium sp. CF4.19]|uniref:LysE family translocator n=1 Tax=Aeromicrobium sp. CF4.19 TaxID=3373082 RepID=UPI003EE5C79B
MSLQLLLAFCGVAVLAYVTPGPDWFVVMRHAATSRRAGVVAAAGVQTGLVVHMAAAALGVAAVLVASAEAFTVLKLLGAAYLVYLGGQALLQSRYVRQEHSDDAPVAQLPLVTVYRQAAVANVLNPKAALFFLAVIPQFVAASGSVAAQVLVLGAIDIAIGLLWWAVFVVGVGGVRALLGHVRARTVIDRVAGVSLVGLGGALALAEPPRR